MQATWTNRATTAHDLSQSRDLDGEGSLSQRDVLGKESYKSVLNVEGVPRHRRNTPVRWTSSMFIHIEVNDSLVVLSLSPASLLHRG